MDKVKCCKYFPDELYIASIAIQTVSSCFSETQSMTSEQIKKLRQGNTFSTPLRGRNFEQDLVEKGGLFCLRHVW